MFNVLWSDQQYFISKIYTASNPPACYYFFDSIIPMVLSLSAGVVWEGHIGPKLKGWSQGHWRGQQSNRNGRDFSHESSNWLHCRLWLSINSPSTDMSLNWINKVIQSLKSLCWRNFIQLDVFSLQSKLRFFINMNATFLRNFSLYRHSSRRVDPLILVCSI